MKTNDIRFIDYQTGRRGQGKCVVYNGSKVHGSRITGPDSFLGV